jgi:hypothetical protein
LPTQKARITDKTRVTTLATTLPATTPSDTAWVTVHDCVDVELLEEEEEEEEEEEPVVELKYQT